jgi:dihydrofolate reductase
MRRIIANFFTSVDGVVESPDRWHFPYFSDEMGQLIGAGMQSASAFLLGRRGYDDWAAYWPGRTEDPFAGFINDIEKVVLTHRPEDLPEWANTTVISEDAADRVRALKADGEGDIMMSGSATTVRWLLAEGLLDELHLVVDPIAVGSGARLFDGAGEVRLELASSETLPHGVLHVVYTPAAAAA